MTTRRRFLFSSAATATLAAREDYARPIDELRRKYRIPGLSAVITRSGEIVWKDGFGYADILQRRPAMPDTPYPIGGLTQALSSTLALMLMEQGRLHLDVPAKQYVPLASPNYYAMKDGAIKIRHLLTHTSEGIPAGETFAYSLSRYAALTYALTQLSGKAFADLVAERFFDAVPMPDSAPSMDATAARYQRVLSSVAHPYNIDSQGRMVTAAFPDPALTAARGLVSTAVDLAKFDLALDEHQFVREETLRLARTPAESLTGKPLRCGLGWFAGYHRTFRVSWLFDETQGAFSGIYFKAPEKRASMILLANTDGLSRPFPGMAQGDYFANDFIRWFLETL